MKPLESIQSLFSLQFLFSGNTSSTPQCRYLPSDPEYPSSEQWADLNSTVGGRLIATVPIGTPCHDPNYDEAACQAVRDGWTNPSLHDESSSSVMAAFWANESCDPFTPKERPCELGNYVSYAVNVSGAEDVAAGIGFARERNVRLVVRNSGHDYLGKSTGAGALALWVHHLKDIHFVDWTDSYYTGKAIKVGAGVQLDEAYKAAYERGFAVVGGVCPTVAFAGGYTQGGGHSPLSSRYGLAADQVLEWEVVDASGQLLVATREKNKDLYWALSGGGGGTYGVVVSMTSKVHADVPVAAANITISASGLELDTFWTAVAAWHDMLPSLLDHGIMATAYIMNDAFAVSPINAPGLSSKELASLLQPYFDQLDKSKITYKKFVGDFPGHLPEHEAMQPPQLVSLFQGAGWLIPRSVVEERNDALTAAFRSVMEDGGMILSLAINASREVAGDFDNSVLPAWRRAAVLAFVATGIDITAPRTAMIPDQQKLTDDFMPRLKQLAPESGSYLNEADYQETDWQTAFYGDNYQELSRIKAKYDPDDLFYGITAVGSERFYIADGGRLCRSA